MTEVSGRKGAANDSRTSADTAMVASFSANVAALAMRVARLWDGQRLCSV